MPTKRKKRTTKKTRAPRLRLGRIAAILLAGYAAFGAWNQEQAIRSGPETQRVFAAFGRLDVSPLEFSRMRESPFPPARIPATARWHAIAEVMDADTIRLDGGQTVRLAGVDAPESSENRKLYTDLGKMNLTDAKPVLVALGKTAARAARDRALGKRCWLEADGRDQYDRVLAVVHLEDGTILNEWLIAQGFAKAYSVGSFQYRKRYIALQLMAQREERGFWRSHPED